MAKHQPVSDADILAIDLAVESERSGMAIDRQADCDDPTIALAEQLRAVLAEMRAELHERCAEQGISHNVVDIAWRAILKGMLGPGVH